MIIDRQENIARYMGISGSLDHALGQISAFVERYQPKTRLDGHGDKMYANCMRYETSADPDKLWESHRDYIDIHVVVEGREAIQLTGAENAKEHAPYDEAVEAALYIATPEASVILEPGSFGVFFPGEIHRAGVSTGENGVVVSKMVMKVLARA